MVARYLNKNYKAQTQIRETQVTKNKLSSDIHKFNKRCNIRLSQSGCAA